MQLQNLGKLTNAINVIKEAPYSFEIATTAISMLNKEQMATALSASMLTEAQKRLILTNAGLTIEEVNLAMATLAQDAANKGATLSTFSLTAALQGLKTAVLTNPILMATAVVAGLFAVYKVVDLLTVSFEEQKEIVDGLQTEIEGLRIEYDELNSKGNLSAQEQEKLKMLERQLAVKRELFCRNMLNIVL